MTSTLSFLAPFVALALLFGAMANSASGSGAVRRVPVAAETEATAHDGANDAAIWIDPDDPGGSLILGSGDTGGIEFYALDGQRLGVHSGSATTQVELRDGFPLGGSAVTLVAADDRGTSSVQLFVLDAHGPSLRPVAAAPIEAGFEITGLCLYRSPISAKHYAFIVGEAGHIQQWELYDDRAGRVAARHIRTLGSGFGSAYCAADDEDGAIYVSEETVGIWRIDAEPETDGERAPIDIVVPFGRLGDEVKGLAIYRGAAGGGWLVASVASENRFTVYALDSGAFAGSFEISGRDAIDAVEEAEGLAAAAALQTPEFPRGLLLAADDDNDDHATNYKLVSWDAVVQALALPAVPAGTDTTRSVANIEPLAETDPVDDAGDAADDPAIWVHPRDPALSLILGAQKQRGLYVYDLDGRTLQVAADGRMNNVDLRYGFALDGRRIDIVAASNRDDNSISLYSIDSRSRRLSPRLASIPTGLDEVYGLCMYHSRLTGAFHVFVNDTDGRMQQWQLEGSGATPAARLVREFRLDSQPEGCVADDETGALYVGEEAAAVWKYLAEPDGGDARTEVDNTRDGNLVADVEGISLYLAPDGGGWLVVSCQGDNLYAVYRRDGDNAFAGYFRVVANAALGIDGASETDGLDVTSASLGPRFPAGLFVAQDGRNVMPAQRQNFKLVSWADIATALTLTPGFAPQSAP
jgi:3-phytase